jgi:hypothetical protein
MFAITTRINNRPVTLDLHQIPIRLPDGRESYAHLLDRNQPFAAVKALGIDVEPGSGWQTSALALAVHQHQLRQAAG